MIDERPEHTQQPAEGAEEDVEAQGVQKAGDPSNPGSAEEAGAEKRAPKHTQEPAEGGDEDVEAPGADRPGSGA